MPASMMAVAAHEATEVVITPKAAEQTVFRSKLPDIPINNHLPLHTYLLEKASEFADSPCLISGATGRVYTFAETFLLCRRTACGLSRLGVKQHDVVFLLLPNCPEFAFAFLAASMLGAATTTANPFFTPSEIYKQYKASGATLVLTQAAYVDKLRDERFGEGLTVVTVDEPPHGCVAFEDLIAGEKEEELPEVVIRPDDPVTIPFSSGTTGLPKGVVLTHRSLVTNIAQQVDGENPNVHLGPGDVMLCVLPLFHIFSLSEVLMCSLRSGAAVLLMAKFEMGLMLELVQRWKVTAAAVVPPLVLALAKSKEVEECDLSSVRLVLSGAAPIGKELLDSLQQRMPHAVFGQGYGMTEAGPAISMSSAFAKDPFPAKSGSCGIIVRNAEVKVVDPETGLSLRRNQHGEICIRGPQIMKGYLNAPEATAAIIDSQGWLHTGDIGYVDDDLEVFIVDRVKELIKFKCFQVAPAELEALLITHPSISDAAVVPLKDEVAGEIPVAFVVRSQGADLTEEAVKQFVAKQVVFYKRVHKIYFVESIPKSVSGKILRKELRARLDASA